MAASPNLHSDALALWGIQDNLLQWYRSIFITSQAVLISFAATLLTAEQHKWLAGLLLGAGLLTWRIWKDVCANRGRDVALCQWLLLRSEAGFDKAQQAAIDAGLVTVFKRFQKTGRFGEVELLSDPSFLELLESTTRRRMDQYVPIAFLFIWACIAVFLIGHYVF